SAETCEFVPAFRPESVGRVFIVFEHFEGEGIDRPLGVASSRKCLKAPGPHLSQDAFGHDRAGAVAGAQEQYIVPPFGHRFLLRFRSSPARSTIRPFASGVGPAFSRAGTRS